MPHHPEGPREQQNRPEYVESMIREHGWEECNSPDEIEGTPTMRPTGSNMIVMRFQRSYPDEEAKYIRRVLETEKEGHKVSGTIRQFGEYSDRQTLLEAVNPANIDQQEETLWRVVSDLERQPDGGWIDKVED